MQIDEFSNEVVKLRNQLTACIECCISLRNNNEDRYDGIENRLRGLFNEIEEISKRINELTKK